MNKARGEGRIFLRGTIYWIAYCRNGKEMRESSESTDERDARKLLRKRLEEIKKPEFVGPTEKKLDLEDLEKKIKADYIRHGRRSWDTVENCLKPVKNYFPHDRLIAITASRIEDYQDHRLEKGMERATVNREVRYLLHRYKLLFEANEISYVPRAKLLEGENVREGFINRPEFEAGAEKITDADVQDIVSFLYNSAWRSGEAKKLEWTKVDTNDWVIRLSRKDEKTKRPRTLALVGELREIMERRLESEWRSALLSFIVAVSRSSLSCARLRRHLKKWAWKALRLTICADRPFATLPRQASVNRKEWQYPATGPTQFIRDTTSWMRRCSARPYTEFANIRNRRRKSARWFQSGVPDELGQFSDKKAGNARKANLIYVGQALNW